MGVGVFLWGGRGRQREAAGAAVCGCVGVGGGGAEGGKLVVTHDAGVAFIAVLSTITGPARL